MKAELLFAAVLSAQAPACFAWGSRAKAPQPQAKASAAPSSPLEPLTAAEIDAAGEALRASKLFSDSADYLSISLQEPTKDEPAPDHRLAFALVYDRQRRETSEAVVDVTGRRLESWRLMPGVEPGLSDAELRQARELALADPRWRQALEERGRGAWDDVVIDGWTPGPLDPARTDPHRLVRADFYVPTPRGRRRIEGLQALLDLTDAKVVQLSDRGGIALPAPAAPGTIDISTAPGPSSFALAGHEISWRGWRFRYALTPREGLVIYRAAFGPKARGVVSRASLSESLVVYGDGGPEWSARDLFQEGERGWGQRAVPLQPGLDAPAGAALIDEARAGGSGRGEVVPRAVAVYERDGERSGQRRARELVVRAKALAGSESYAFSWVFGDDGELGAAASVEAPASSEPAHQHFFNYRVDFDVDGATNSIDELEAAAPQRPSAAAALFSLRRTPLEGHEQARRDVDGAAGRRWLIKASSSGAASEGYLLLPQGNDAPLFPPGSAARKAAPFIEHQLWVTAYHPDELYAAGEYPGRRARPGGVERWTRRDESIRDGDVVVWYTLGATHLTFSNAPSGRPLETGFRLAPSGR